MKSIPFSCLKRLGALLAAAFIFASVSGCGQKGPLVPADQAPPNKTQPKAP